MISTFCSLAGRVRTAKLVLNSKYLPGLRMLAGIWSKVMFGLAMGYSFAAVAALALVCAAGTKSPSAKRRR